MKKINLISVQEKLKENNLRLFTILDFQRMFKLSYAAAKKALGRYVRVGLVIKAKKGLYFLKNNPPLDFELANRLYGPSYVSFDTALSYYGIISETVYEVTSATVKISRQFTVRNLKFSYKKIKKDCFFGYRPEKIRDSVVLIAEPEKALADYLYFVALKKRKLAYERINFKKIKKAKLIQYVKCFKNKRILEIIKMIYD